VDEALQAIGRLPSSISMNSGDLLPAMGVVYGSRCVSSLHCEESNSWHLCCVIELGVSGKAGKYL
jgi:hypothetical protein